MIRVYIGSNPNGSDTRPVAVLKASILSNTDSEVEFIEFGDGSGGTGFSTTRYSIPYLTQGVAIYLDADMMVFGDIKDLHDMALPGVWVSSETYPKGSSAVSVIDCSVNLPFPVNPKPLYYDKQLVEAGVMRPLIPEAWNCRNYYKTDYTKLIHYTTRRLQPWNHKPTRDIDYMWLEAEAKL